MDTASNQQPDTSRLWDEKETARYLACSVEFLQADRAAKVRIPFVRNGRSIRYDPADVIAYKDRCKVRGAPELGA